jgi:hypothetical protein
MDVDDAIESFSQKEAEMLAQVMQITTNQTEATNAASQAAIEKVKDMSQNISTFMRSYEVEKAAFTSTVSKDVSEKVFEYNKEELSRYRQEAEKLARSSQEQVSIDMLNSKVGLKEWFGALRDRDKKAYDR